MTPTRVVHPLVLLLVALFSHSPASGQEVPPGNALGEGQAAGAAVLNALAPGLEAATLFPRGEAVAQIASSHIEGAGTIALVQTRTRGSVPVMAAGTTLLVTGAVIGGDAGTLLMVGGAGILAWGVYLHF